MFHLRTARVIKDSIRGEHRFTGEDAHAFSFGGQRFLTGCMNRLWSMNQTPESKKRGEPMYKHDWHRTGEFIEFDFMQGVRYVWLDGERMDVETWFLQIFFESDAIEATFGWTHRFPPEYDTMDITFKLILLQRWFRKSNARRRPRRLALAMALHPRLGNGSSLSIIPTELAYTLMLAAT